ncbi:hypothetical protein GCM10007935_43660 [Hydrogenophaga electricum]|uniref:Uncharacterized protein n=1 Tax=Hydrogenophaga electricum TaxID=1230953 RepID=A0ABQ6CE29_9BURK|nr:hypothetical protein GCM10007935_43660 [Hydrogenophaga electricum]
MVKGSRRCTSTAASTGRPSHMLRVRKLRGGNPVTPSFMMGQLTPQMRVSRTSRVSWRRDRGILAMLAAGGAGRAAPGILSW